MQFQLYYRHKSETQREWVRENEWMWVWVRVCECSVRLGLRIIMAALARPTVLYSKVYQIIRRRSIYQENTNNHNNFRNNYNFLRHSLFQSGIQFLLPFTLHFCQFLERISPPPPVNQLEIKTKSILKRNCSYLNEILNKNTKFKDATNNTKCKRVYKTWRTKSTSRKTPCKINDIYSST